MRQRADNHEAHLKEQALARKKELIKNAENAENIKFASDEDGEQL
jgi:hypothetical protein